MPSGSALTSSALWIGLYRHTSMASSTPRNSAATSAANTRAKPMLATTTSRRRVSGPAVQLALPPQRPSGRVGRDDERGGDDRRLDEEDRPPVEQLGEHAAERRADSDADGAGHRPPPPGPPLASDDRAEHGERPGQQSVAPTPWTPRAASRNARLVATPATSEAAANTATPATTSDSGRTRRWTSATGTAVDRDDQRVRRQHPRHPDDRRVELGVEVGQGEGDDRRVGERQPDRADQQRGAQPLPRTHGRAR